MKNGGGAGGAKFYSISRPKSYPPHFEGGGGGHIGLYRPRVKIAKDILC